MRRVIINLMPGFLVRIFARPYVSGNSIDKGIAKADDLWNTKGISSTLDLLGEAVYTREDVQYNVDVYLELLEKCEGKEYVTVSIKPSALGSHESEAYLEENIRTILDAAKKHGIEITLDMEDHTFTDLTLKLYRKLLNDYPTFGTVLQSRLFRTFDDIKAMDDLKTRVRMCIGIYNEDKSIALQVKRDMKEKMVEMSKYLMDKGDYVEFATHDEEFIDQFLVLAKENNWTGDQLEFQHLLGVPMAKKQKEILEAGYKVRLYVPFATKWSFAIPYLKRRLANNPKMAFYVIGHLFSRDH
ncbi:MAG: proline dehydrogenase family protein [Candidatus Heimdallarchaeota archaeon]|nr:proline dehydrogenase family protein [Candidatus Heimdallarchaeota archaeon]